MRNRNGITPPAAIRFGRIRSFVIAIALIAVPALLVIGERSNSASAVSTQPPAAPVNGMRPADLRTHAITGATIVTAPGATIGNGTIIMRDGVIEWVGPAGEARVPAGAQTWDGKGLTVYAGLIEPALMMRSGELPASSGAYWNAKVRAEINMADQPPPDRALRKDLRAMGFTCAAVFPDAGALRGSGVVLALADEDGHVRPYLERSAMAAAFDYGFGGGGPPTPPSTPATPGPAPATPRPQRDPNVDSPPGGGGGSRGYPASLMGAIALLRQALLDAQWRGESMRVAREHPENHEPLPAADALDALLDVLAGRQPVLFDVRDEHMAMRADRLAREFDLDLWLLGSGFEFRRLDEVVALQRPIIVPLEFPRRQEVNTLSQADAQTLTDLMTWEQAPTNPRRLAKAGATIVLTTHRLRNRSDFHANLRNAIKHGLTEDQALAALTTTPAKLLGVENTLGTIEPGKIANLVVVKGSLFDKDAKVRDVWVNGRRSEISAEPKLEVNGEGELVIDGLAAPAPVTSPDTSSRLEATTAPADHRLLLELNTSKSTATLIRGERKIAAKRVMLAGDQISFVFDSAALSADVLPVGGEGYARLGGAVETIDDGFAITGNIALPDGTMQPFSVLLRAKPQAATAAATQAGDASTQPQRDDDDAEIDAPDAVALAGDVVTGEWTISLAEAPDMAITMSLRLGEGGAVTGSVSVMGQAMPLTSGQFDAATGKLQLTAPTPTGQNAQIEATISGRDISGTASGPQGDMQLTGKREGPSAPAVTDDPSGAERDTSRDRQGAEGRGGRGRRGARGGAGGGGAGGEDETRFEMPPENLNHPFGDYGLAQPPRPQNILITNATIWTCNENGDVLENGWMRVRDGKIDAMGRDHPPAEPGAKGDADDLVVIDASGKHITPGLIDCHSHTGIDGGVNEGTQANTAEVRIGDCIDPDDINFYRQLAGGLTACNQLHGSANPIGGQNSVVKLKWGQPASAFPIDNAIPGIKFALGENVKRSTSRYPNTRMGVETFIRDAFTAAQSYRAAHQRYESLGAEEQSRALPPRRDLEMETLAEILEGRRIIHCHSYRQDEILMLIRLADDFGFKIGTFQHVLEGYKVADAIAKHGAGASTFSDWWAYKIEVIDAIPFNGSLMDKVGCVVSFNSDSDELARRMNWEAAKAVRYGDLTPEEALKFVTINPAKQLRIDSRTGSLEEGKDADFVIWSGDPLSTYSHCEQTWIEGAKYFDQEQDRRLQEEVQRERQRIMQKILRQAHGEIERGSAKPQAATSPGSAGAASTQSQAPSPPASPPPPEPELDRDAAATPRPRLLSRMLQQRIDWMEEQLRLGRDPDEIRPGDCGCSDLDLLSSNS